MKPTVLHEKVDPSNIPDEKLDRNAADTYHTERPGQQNPGERRNEGATWVTQRPQGSGDDSSEIGAHETVQPGKPRGECLCLVAC